MFAKLDVYLTIPVLFLVAFGLFILGSLAPNIFPSYFVYVLVALIAFWFFSQVGFEVVSIFSKHLYIISLVLLVLTLIIGEVTRGSIRWIPIANLTFQPAEIIRPLILVFFANFLTKGSLNFSQILKAVGLFIIPVFLILIQPSLGVAVLTVIGFFGVLLASDFNKKYILTGIVAAAALIPLFWLLLAPYQKVRLATFLNPENDPLGVGYNGIQSKISVGAGKIFGRGFGKGTQTQLAFLPEKHTDFIFASIAEELGFVGSSILIVATFLILYRLTKYMESAVSPASRAYLSGFFLTYLAQVLIHIGMNLGLLPITGLPLPLVSAGGSSLLATMIGLGLALGSVRR